MSKSKHTPGPWEPIMEFGIQTSNKDIAYLPEGDWFKEKYYPELYANIPLIAAAPCMLEALEGILKNIEKPDNNFNELDIIYKAIAKAKGESE